MFALTEDVRFFLCRYPVRFNVGINGLLRIIESQTVFSPVSGDAFVFFSKDRHQVKILRWDTDGYILYQKRLARGCFRLPDFNEETGSYEMNWDTFYAVMKGIDFGTVSYDKRFRMKAQRFM